MLLLTIPVLSIDCCSDVYTQVLKVRDSTAFLALTTDQRRNVFKDAAAEVSRMVSMHTTLLLHMSTTTTRT
jgi:hypothetical protein